MMQDITAQLQDKNKTAEEEAAGLAGTLAEYVAGLEARHTELQTLQETMIPTGNIIETPEVAVGYPLYFPVRSPAFPFAHRRTALSRCLLQQQLCATPRLILHFPVPIALPAQLPRANIAFDRTKPRCQSRVGQDH